jgi:hypothetical protein
MADFNPADLEDYSKGIALLKKNAIDFQNVMGTTITGASDLAKKSAGLLKQLSKAEKIKALFNFNTDVVKQTQKELDNRKAIFENVLKESDVVKRSQQANLRSLILQQDLAAIRAKIGKSFGKEREDLTKQGKLTANQIRDFNTIKHATGEISADSLRTVKTKKDELTAAETSLQVLYLQSKQENLLTKLRAQSLGSFGEIGKTIENIVGKLKEFSLAELLILSIVGFTIERYLELDKAGEKFRRSTGLLASQSKVWGDAIEQNSLQYRNIGVTVEKATIASEALVNTFGSGADSLAKASAFVSVLSANLGISEDISAKMLQNFMGMSGESEASAENLIGAAITIAKSTKGLIPLNKLMTDIANVSGKTLSFLKGNPKELIKAAVAARMAGTNIENITDSAESLLDFNQSINKEQTLSVLLGRNINLNAMRQAAFSGDLSKLAQEQVNFLNEQGGLQDKNYIEVNAMADAMAMSVDQLTKMNAQQQLLKTASPEIVAAYKAQMASLDKQVLTRDDLIKQGMSEVDIQKTLQKQADDQLTTLAAHQEMQAQQTQVLNQLAAVGTELGQSFLPIIQTILPGIVDLVKLIGLGIKVISTFVGGLISGFGKVTGLFDTSQATFANLSTMIDTASARFDGWYKSLSRTWKIVGGVVMTLVSVALLSKTIFGWVFKIFGWVAKLGEVWEFITTTISVLGGILGSIGSIIGSVIMSPVTLFLAAAVEIGSVIYSIYKRWNDIVAGFSDGSNWLEKLHNGFMQIGKAVIMGLVTPITGLIDWLFGTNITKWFSDQIDGWISYSKGAFKTLENIFSSIPSMLKDGFISVWNFLKNIPLLGMLFGGTAIGKLPDIGSLIKSSVSGAQSLLHGAAKIATMPIDMASKLAGDVGSYAESWFGGKKDDKNTGAAPEMDSTPVDMSTFDKITKGISDGLSGMMELQRDTGKDIKELVSLLKNGNIRTGDLYLDTGKLVMGLTDYSKKKTS